VGEGAPGIAVLDYGIGNLRSAEKALQHLGAPARLVTDADEARAAQAVVLPGVGAFASCMDALRESGLEPVVHEAVDAGKPFLGVCVGMQMLFDESDESPGVRGLGVVPGAVRRLPAGVKVPHMGWNTVDVRRDDGGLFAGLGDAPWLYFVHSYAPEPADESVVAGTTEYGTTLCAAIERGPLWATQFHPEKSSAVGLGLLANFVRAAGF
jgi:glutamine amidotransferase